MLGLHKIVFSSLATLLYSLFRAGLLSRQQSGLMASLSFDCHQHFQCWQSFGIPHQQRCNSGKLGEPITICVSVDLELYDTLGQGVASSEIQSLQLNDSCVTLLQCPMGHIIIFDHMKKKNLTIIWRKKRFNKSTNCCTSSTPENARRARTSSDQICRIGLFSPTRGN